MSSKKPKHINDRVSKGKITNISEKVFEIETNLMQNSSYAQKKENVKFFFSKDQSHYFNPSKKDSMIHVVFNNRYKEYIEQIYDSRWNLIYSKH